MPTFHFKNFTDAYKLLLLCYNYCIASSTDNPNCTLSIKGGSITKSLQTEVLESDLLGIGEPERRDRLKNYRINSYPEMTSFSLSMSWTILKCYYIFEAFLTEYN